VVAGVLEGAGEINVANWVAERRCRDF